jgi:hypothetical protein
MEENGKRAATRIEVPLIGIITFYAEGEGPKTIEVVAKDISLAGAYLWVSAPRPCPRVGDKIEVNLRSDSELEEFQLSVEAVGTVVRVDLPQEGDHGFAIKFAKVPDFRPG